MYDDPTVMTHSISTIHDLVTVSKVIILFHILDVLNNHTSWLRIFLSTEIVTIAYSLAPKL